MARLLIDGFESGGYGLYDASANASVISSAGKDLDGSYCLDLTAAGAYIYKATAAAGMSEVYLAALWRPSAPSDLQPIFRLQNGVSVVATLYRNNSTNKLQAYLGGVSLIATGTKTISNDTTYFIEVYFKLADAGGRFVVKIDGVIDIDFTGDTEPATHGTFNRIYLGRDDATQTTKAYFDNFKIDDAAYPGSDKIQAIVPTGAGTTTEWTPSVGANWECVNEIPKNDADYVNAAGILKDTYAAGNVSGSIASIKCVQVQSRSKSISFTNTIKLIVRSGGADYEGDGGIVAASFKSHYYIWETNPADSAAWEEADVNAIEIGIKNNTGNNLGSYQVLAQVEWAEVTTKDVDANNVECLTQVTAAAFIRELDASNVECLSQVTAPTLTTQLAANNIDCLSQVTVPALSVKRQFSIPNIECLTEITAGWLGVGWLSPPEEMPCNTEVTVPAFSVKREITIPDIESSTEVGAPAAVRIAPLNASDISCNSEVTLPSIYKELFPSDIECSSEVEAADLEWIKILKLNATLPMITTEMSGGHGGFLNVELPMITAEMRAGARLNVILPMITAEIEGSVGIKADLNVTLPMIKAVLEGDVEVLGELNATLPMVTARMAGTAGLAGQLNVTLPMITAALAGYTDIDGQLNVTLPMIEARLVGTVERDACPILRYEEPELE